MKTATEKLREELFETVQGAQGRAYISDAPDHCTSRAELLDYARTCLYWTNESAQRLRAFIRKVELRSAGSGEEE